MKPEALIEAYVVDVVSSLPRRQRHDVGYELRALLIDELQGRAGDAGREPDDQLALELLADFGRPSEVADRYRPPGFTIIKPADAPRFAWIGLGGVVVQWVLTLTALVLTPVEAGAPGTDWLSRLGSWWLSWGLGAFWWPGFIISLTVIAALIASRRETRDEERGRTWTPPSIAAFDRDRVSRAGMAIVIALGVVGAAIVIALPLLAAWAPWLNPQVLAAFEFDADFLAWRAPWVLLLWAASLAIGIAVLVAGRWQRVTRILSVALDAAWILLLVWWIVAGPVFTTSTADTVTKGCLALIVVFTIIDLVVNARRLAPPIHAPAV